MALVAYYDFPKDKEPEYKEINYDKLISCVYEYARTQDNESLYDSVMKEKISISVNGETIHPDNWAFYTIEDDDKILVSPVLEKGSFGAFLQIVIGVALIAFAPQFSPVVAKYMMAAGISFALGGLSSLLFSPTLPKYQSDTSSQTYSFGGIKTIAQEGSPVPIVYGTHPVGGNVISIFTEAGGENNYLYMEIALCEGEIEGICQDADHTSVCTTSNTSDSSYKVPAIEIDEQPIDVYNNIEWWYRTGTNNDDNTKDQFYPFAQNRIPYFSDARVQYSDGREITSDGTIYQTTKEIDMVTLQLRAPALYNGLGSNTITYKIEYKKEADSIYTEFEANRWSPLVTGIGNSSGGCTCTTYNTGTIIYGDIIDNDYRITVLENHFNYSDMWDIDVPEHGLKYYYYDIDLEIKNKSNDVVEYRTITNSIYCKSVHTATSGYESGTGPIYETQYIPQVTGFYVGRYAISLTQNVSSGDIYDISSISLGKSSEIIMTGKTATGLWDSITLDFRDISTGNEIWDIKITRTDGGATDSLTASNTFELQSVLEIIQGNFIYPNTALLGLRIKASGQLSGSPPNVKVLIKGLKVPVPDIEDTSPSGSNIAFEDCVWDDNNQRFEDNQGNIVYWNDTTSWRTGSDKEYTNNSMVCLRDLMTNERYGLGKYFNTTDLYTAGIRSNLKTCHVRYDGGLSGDFVSWWDNGIDNNWIKQWSLQTKSSNVDLSYNKSARTITMENTTGTMSVESCFLKFDCTTSLKTGHYYDINFTVSNVLPVGTYAPIYDIVFVSSSNELINVSSSNILTDGTESQTIQATVDVKSIILQFKKIIDTGGFKIVLTDVSVTHNDSSSYKHYHTYNGVLDSEQAADSTIIEMCNSFRCWPVWYNGVFNFVLDQDDTPMHTIGMGNIREFSQSFSAISDIPKTLTAQFTDEARDYDLRDIKSISSDTTLNELGEKTIGLKGITNRQKAERELVFKHNKLVNCTHIVNFKCGLDMIHGTAGDIVNLSHDLPSWGQSGRILDYDSINASITVDEEYTFDNVATYNYIINYQNDNNDFLTASIDMTSISNNDSLRTFKVQSWTGTPCSDSVYTVGVASTCVKPFRIILANRSKIDELEITAIEHLSSLYSGEPTLTVVDDNYSDIPNPSLIPNPPIYCSVAPILESDRVGFELFAKPAFKDTITIEIIVEMTKTGNITYEEIARIPISAGNVTYINNNLVTDTPDNSYNFRFYSKTAKGKISSYVELNNILLEKVYFEIPSPTGIRIKDSNSNTTDSNSNHLFYGKDCSLIWNPVGVNYNSNINVNGYNVKVYHDSVSNDNLLRTAFVTGTEYTYTLDNNTDDSSTGSPYSTLVFVITTVSNTTESTVPSIFRAKKYNPPVINSLDAASVSGGVKFEWGQSSDLGHKGYNYQTKVSSGSYSASTLITNNSFTRSLTTSEIDTYGDQTSVYIKVSDVDVYDQISSSMTVSATSNLNRDGFFQIRCSLIGSFTGNCNTLYDSDLSSGVTSY